MTGLLTNGNTVVSTTVFFARQIITLCTIRQLKMNKYINILDAISDLQARGFFLEFVVVGNKLLCTQQKFLFSAEEFEVIEIYQFDAVAHGPGEIIVLAIELIALPLRGILLSPDGRTPVPPFLFQKMRKFWT